MKFRPTTAVMVAFAALLTPAAAFAHPRLVAATPSAKATVGQTRTIRLTFSERLMPTLSKATLTMTGMPGMVNHAPMKVTAVTSAVAANGKALVLTAARPLAAGSYRVDWVIVGADSHRIAGAHTFSVK